MSRGAIVKGRPVETVLGPIVRSGAWTVSLEITRCESPRRARGVAYRIAGEALSTFEDDGFDVRVVDLADRSVVSIEVAEPDDFERVIAFLTRTVRAWSRSKVA